MAIVQDEFASIKFKTNGLGGEPSYMMVCKSKHLTMETESGFEPKFKESQSDMQP